jgi:transcriptional regulator with XRE-family HTH domain
MSASESTGDRIEAIRAILGITQAEMAARTGIALRTYSHYISGRTPSAELLEAVGRMGFNIFWLLTGEGPMRQGEESAPPSAATSHEVDPDLYGRVLEAISTVYKELGWAITLRQLGAEASRIATEIAADGLAPEDVPGAVRGAAAMLRRQLRDSQANPAADTSLKDRA